MKRIRPSDYLQGRVYEVCNPERFGKVVKRGEEVSEVRWDDGRLQYVTNEYLRKAGEES